jgi:CheY-like chemotaxis protein
MYSTEELPCRAHVFGNDLTMSRNTDQTARHALVVDDDPIFRYAFTRLVRSFGWTADEADGGTQALAACRDVKPNVIFLDLHMPDKDGFEVCAELRADPRCADATIIAVSGITRNIIETRAIACGFDSYLLKPVDKELLGAVLQTAAR